MDWLFGHQQTSPLSGTAYFTCGGVALPATSTIIGAVGFRLAATSFTTTGATPIAAGVGDAGGGGGGWHHVLEGAHGAHRLHEPPNRQSGSRNLRVHHCGQRNNNSNVHLQNGKIIVGKMLIPKQTTTRTRNLYAEICSHKGQTNLPYIFSSFQHLLLFFFYTTCGVTEAQYCHYLLFAQKLCHFGRRKNVRSSTGGIGRRWMLSCHGLG